MYRYSDGIAFQSINLGYDAIFRPNRLSIGLALPLERYSDGPVPTMDQHIERVRLAEALGFSAVWIRDVPFNVPSFGDAGQLYDPFVYLGFLAAMTNKITLGVASIILPLRHPAHVAKAASSIDVLSNGRLVLGVASGDRPEEYPALAMSFEDRGDRFRESLAYIRQMSEDRPIFENLYGSAYEGMDMLPKPVSGKLPMLVTGASQQDRSWIAQNSDGWITYPRKIASQAKIIKDWRKRVESVTAYAKPVMQPLYVDLVDDRDAMPQPIHLGFRSGIKHLLAYLKSLEEIGINHVSLNLRFNQVDSETTLRRLANEVLPEFAV